MIKYDSDINDRIVTSLNESKETVNSELSSKIESDYSSLVNAGLFTTQLQNIKKAASSFEKSLQSLSTLVENNKNNWAEKQTEINNKVRAYSQAVASTYSSGVRMSSGSGSVSTSSAVAASSDVSQVSKGKEISTNTVKDFIINLEEENVPVLVKKLDENSGDKSIVELLLDSNNSQELMKILKNLLGDTTNGEDTLLDSELIQKLIIKKLNNGNADISSDEERSLIEKLILEYKNKNIDLSKWNELIYGDNTTKIDILDGTFVVADTKQDLEEYASYVEKNGVRQNSDTSKYSDYCLAFAHVHAYDLYTGEQHTATEAGNYAKAGEFVDYIDDSKENVLAKVYDEIMSGRPVVLQVNGNKEGTSRHFVTVVGFKDGVTSASTLKETDLLIIDSWDGKIERMDTSSSRFMTTGADCHKDYSGYRLRVLKS